MYEISGALTAAALPGRVGTGSNAMRYLGFFVVLCSISLASTVARGAVVISEFMASNDFTLADEDGEFSDWIEVHNNGAGAVDLQGWYLTDDDGQLTTWQFPATSLGPGEYLVVFASDKNRTVSGSELHTDFKLSAGGEYLALVLPDGQTIADEYAPEYPQQFTDISYGGNQYFTEPTPGSANGPGFAGLVEPVVFSVDHGFYDTPQVLTMSTATNGATIRYTLDGSTPVSALGCVPPTDGKPWAYEYFEGAWSVLPDFDTLTPVATGTADAISTAPRLRNTNFGLRFTGCIYVERAGQYTFSTRSDDGSQLFVDGALIVDNDQLHSPQTVSDTVQLSAGLHAVAVTMFQAGGGQTLSADWISPSRSNAYVFTEDNGNFSDSPAVTTNTDFVEFEFDIVAQGNYQFDARIQGLNGDSDSFWVQLDGGPVWLFDTSSGNAFQTRPVNDRGNGNVTANMTIGSHRLRFYVREDGTRLDSVTIRGVNCDGPCEPQLLEVERANINGSFLLAGSVTESLQGVHWRTYSGPLNLASTTTVRAVAVKEDFFSPNPATQTYLFLDDIITQSRNGQAPSGWPTGPINGQQLDYGMDPQVVDADPQGVKAALSSLPAISIVTDLDNLLHPEIGIYTNAENKGRYWERPASLELIDGSGAEPGFTIDAGIRIRGGFSRTGSNPKHAFRVFFRGSYGGDLEYPLFGSEGGDEFEKVDLRTSQNYSWAFDGDDRNTFLREVWSRDTQGAMNQAYTRSRYYHLFINGVYWGIFMTQERVSKEFASTYFGGSDDDYDVVKHNRSDNFRFEATDGNNTAWNTLWNYVSDQVVGGSEYAAIQQVVDLENLVDYVMLNAYEGDTDGAPSSFLSSFRRSNNWYAVFDRVNGVAKWTFYQHDGEHTLGIRRNSSLEENLLGPYPPFNGQSNQFFFDDYFNPYWLHAALTTHPDYRQLFIDRAAVHFAPEGALSPTSALSRWTARKAQVAPAILAESARWGDAKVSTPFGVADWQAEVNYVENTFFPTRAQVVFDQLMNAELASSLPPAEFSVPSGSVVEPGTEISITNRTGVNVYYTIDGSDPRAPGGGIAAGAMLLAPGQTITLTDSTTIRIRFRQGSDWGPISEATFLVNAIPVIDPIGDQITTNGQMVSLALSASDDDPLTWSATGLPTGLGIDSSSGEITGIVSADGIFDVTVTVDDGDVMVDERFTWWVVPEAKLILNEYNAVSGSNYLGGGDNTVTEPADSRLGRIVGNGGDWFELVVVEDRLDIRGWQLSIVDDGTPDQVLTFTTDPLWSDLRAGTIITVAEEPIVAADSTVYDEDAGYDPVGDDWWINVVAGDGGSGQYISTGNFRVSNDSWQLEILDAGGQPVFGPAGEGVGVFSGVNSEEVGKLEEDPQPLINPGSQYNDGTSSTFGEPNLYAGGTQVQDFSALRTAVGSTPEINVTDAVVGEGAAVAQVLVSLSRPSTDDVSFTLATVDESAIAGSDYGRKTGRRTIPAGDSQKTIWIPIVDDSEVEGDESFRLELTEPVNATIGDGTGTITIRDNDSGGSFPVLNISDAMSAEGTLIQFSLTLSEPSTQPITFTITTVDESAIGGADYTPKVGVRTIAAGVIEKTIWVPTIDDVETEGSETFRLEISNVGNAVLGDGIGIGTIVDNDGVAVPRLDISDTTVIEGGTARFVVTLSEPAPLDIFVRILTVSETASSGIDYLNKTGIRLIPVGSTEKELWVPTVDDTETESSETFRLEISDAVNATLGDAVGIATITDND